ncbi:GNAT family N-acetyltransferase [Deinococcus cellulosilyticus]|uniref:Chorismate synthase n=1 Tax=Deinococcus cellulosilyticus (strain DSM 18568 / NBRC 106333 / KACC 11606 / 5516J-15) TaxID=1223518 RepID=A0A511NA00_DEIC1|nr:GNAT family N-acetyltransferase [Deinococcus cellulosilyticus]GEM49397.1 chorismate synthase [Deinococcus cellulosilyticus NBRC 106333 = KACC 11606]
MIEIRELRDHTGVTRIQELQALVWGRSELDIVPQGLTVAFMYQGGLVAGAFDGDLMIGFVMGIPTADPEKQHSHMLGVIPEYRGTDVAVRLKRFQRDWCLSRGIERVVWSFDPMRSVNANFNLRKLGAVVREYHPNLYGQMSGVNAGVDSDRVIAEWNLLAPQVYERIYAPPVTPGIQHLNCINSGLENHLDLQEDTLVYRLPEDFGALVREDLEGARAWRAAGREALMHYLKQGYFLSDFVRQGGNFYVLKREG